MEILVGIVIGLLLALTGAGGSLVALPLLYGVLHLPLQEAVSISLGSVAITTTVGLIPRLKSGDILWFQGLLFAVVASLLTPAGRTINALLPPNWVLGLFSMLVALVAVRMWQQASANPASTLHVRAIKLSNSSATTAICHYTQGKPGPKCIAVLTLAASVTGVLSGLFGVGGGFIIVPILVFLTGVPIQRAVATSLLVISLVSISGFSGYFLAGAVDDYQTIGLIGGGGALGMLAGTLIAKKISGPLLQKGFVICMVGLSLLVWLRSVN